MKGDLKGATGIDTSLASLKTKVDNLDINKIKTVPADLSQLSNVMDNDVVKKTVNDHLVTKVNAIDTEIPSTSELVTKTEYDSDRVGF